MSSKSRWLIDIAAGFEPKESMATGGHRFGLASRFGGRELLAATGASGRPAMSTVSTEEAKGTYIDWSRPSVAGPSLLTVRGQLGRQPFVWKAG